MIYVDAAIWPLGRMKMCHMFADSLEELHAMAEKLGVRRWFQDKPNSVPHYDLCKSVREKAVQLGAVEINRARAGEIIETWRERKRQAASAVAAP